jgi:gas vesicle protein
VGKEPSEIRAEIEQTRGEMGETVEALGYKADVKTRTKENIADKRDRLRQRISGASSRVGDATPDAGDVKQGAKRAAGVAQENPIGLALGSVAVGFVAGMLVPSTRVEDEKIGPMADQVKERAKETGQDALDRGKDVAQQAAESAKETATESGRQQAEELRGTAQQKAEEAKEGAKGAAPTSST